MLMNCLSANTTLLWPCRALDLSQDLQCVGHCAMTFSSCHFSFNVRDWCTINTLIYVIAVFFLLFSDHYCWWLLYFLYMCVCVCSCCFRYSWDHWDLQPALTTAAGSMIDSASENPSTTILPCRAACFTYCCNFYILLTHSVTHFDSYYTCSRNVIVPSMIIVL